MPEPMTAESVSEAIAGLSGWEADGNSAIRKTFKRADHIDAMGFVTRIAMAAEVMDHHPELTIVYNTVSISLSSHDAGGVTQRDLDLAAKIEEYV